jgi:hypothetical protein
VGRNRNVPNNPNDSEMDIILAAARPLAVQDRDGFLKEVAERLAGLPERGEGLVYQVVREVQRRHLCGAHGGAAIDGTTGGRSPVTLAKSVSA